MKICDVELALAEIPRSDGGPPVRSLLVCLITDAGAEGWGEAPLRWRPFEIADRRRALLAALTSRAVFNIEEMLRLDVARHPSAACALEMASWDLVAQAAGQPLCHLLGGCYRQHIPLTVRLPRIQTPELRNVARELAEHGYHCQLVTSVGDVEADVACIMEAAEAAGERAEIQLDGGGRYDLPAARHLCRSVNPDRLSLLLDALAPEDMNGSASLARQTDISLGLCQGITGPRDVMAVVRSGAARHVVVDLHRVGGLLAARRCAAVADAGDVSVSLSAERSLGIAATAMLHVAAATPEYASSNWSNYTSLGEDVLSEGLEVVDGLASVPQAPGLGLKVDRAKLERFLVT